MRALFLIAIGVAAWLVYRLYLKQLLAQGKAGQIKIALIAVGFIFLALAVTGRAPALFAVLGALMTQAMRFWPLLVRFAPGLVKHLGGNPLRGGAAGGAGAGASQVRTATILMSLDHASGQMDGEVLRGEFGGRSLSSLAAAEIIRLHTACRADDPEALRLLEAYIARERADEFENGGRPDDEGGSSGDGPAGAGGRGGDWSGGSGSGPRDGGGAMSLGEASEVLGLPMDADREAIIAAHRTLMSRLHPDKGGSDYLAMKVNAARQVMLDGLSRNG